MSVPCPGCGSTRAAVALFQGNFAEAFAWHPLILVSLLLLVYAVVRYTLFRKHAMPKAEKYTYVALTAAYLGVFVVRMVFLFPHTAPLTMHPDFLLRRVLGLFGV